MIMNFGGDTNIQSIERIVTAGGHSAPRITTVPKPSFCARYALIESTQAPCPQAASGCLAACENHSRGAGEVLED